MIDIMANLRLIGQFRAEGLIEDYAITGAIAGEIWGEPRTFQNLEVIVSPGDPTTITTLNEKLAGLGEEDEFSKGVVRVNGFTTSFVPAEGINADALDSAILKRFPGGFKAKVVRPEYLLVMFLDPPHRNEFLFALDFMQYMNLDFRLIERIVRKHGFYESYKKMDGIYHFKKVRQNAIKEIWHTPKQFKHKVKYHRENARQPLYKKVEAIDHCCSLYIDMVKLKKNWQGSEARKKKT